jgi:hypothetical protein
MYTFSAPLLAAKRDCLTTAVGQRGFGRFVGDVHACMTNYRNL